GRDRKHRIQQSRRHSSRTSATSGQKRMGAFRERMGFDSRKINTELAHYLIFGTMGDHAIMVARCRFHDLGPDRWSTSHEQTKTTQPAVMSFCRFGWTSSLLVCLME